MGIKVYCKIINKNVSLNFSSFWKNSESLVKQHTPHILGRIQYISSNDSTMPEIQFQNIYYCWRNNQPCFIDNLITSSSVCFGFIFRFPVWYRENAHSKCDRNKVNVMSYKKWSNTNTCTYEFIVKGKYTVLASLLHIYHNVNTCCHSSIGYFCFKI